MDASIWDQILTRIETKVNRHSFYTWFKPTSFIADDGSSLRVRVPNPLFRDWLTKHYAAVLGEALAEVDRRGIAVAFVTDEGPLPVPIVPPVTEPAAEPELEETGPAGGL